LSRNPFRLIAFVGLALVLVLQIGVWSPLQTPARAENVLTAPVATFNQASPAVIAAEDAGNTYLNKLFGNFGTPNNAATEQSSGPLEWFLIIFGTIVYGQIAMLVALWILFTADLLGILVGLVLIGIILAFTLPRKPRAIALFVLACLNFVLGAAITVVMAVTEGVPPVLVSLVPLGALVWLALRQLQFHFSAALKS
jgi:hypothetical protein